MTSCPVIAAIRERFPPQGQVKTSMRKIPGIKEMVSGPTKAEKRRLAKSVIEQTDALTRIASEFRHFAGPVARNVQTLEGDQLLLAIEALFRAMAEQRGITFEVRPGAPNATVAVDRQELERVLNNLLLNAFEASAQRVTLASRVADKKLWFTVTDDGPGVPDEVRQKLFVPNFATKSSGTGLGLALCRRIVQAHGGSIALTSSEPGCTVFSVELPLASASHQARAEPALVTHQLSPALGPLLQKPRQSLCGGVRLSIVIVPLVLVAAGCAALCTIDSTSFGIHSGLRQNTSRPLVYIGVKYLQPSK